MYKRALGGAWVKALKTVMFLFCIYIYIYIYIYIFSDNISNTKKLSETAK